MQLLPSSELSNPGSHFPKNNVCEYISKAMSFLQNHERSMLSLYKNQSIDLQFKPIDWVLYERIIFAN